jgi:hypothetical protein
MMIVMAEAFVYLFSLRDTESAELAGVGEG